MEIFSHRTRGTTAVSQYSSSCLVRQHLSAPLCKKYCLDRQRTRFRDGTRTSKPTDQTDYRPLTFKRIISNLPADRDCVNRRRPHDS